MRKKIRSGNKRKKIRDIIFHCSKCGPFVKAFAEVTTKGSDSPFAIEILEPAEMGTYDLEVLHIRPRPEGEIEKYAYCGHCGSLIGHAVINRWGISRESGQKDDRKILRLDHAGDD